MTSACVSTMARNLQLSWWWTFFLNTQTHVWSRNVSSFRYGFSLEMREEQWDPRGRGSMLHRGGGVAHHRVVVRRRAVALQAGVQGRVVQTEVQRRNPGGELVPVGVALHRLFTLTCHLHPEKHKCIFQIM